MLISEITDDNHKVKSIKPQIDESKLGFGTYKTSCIFRCDYIDESGWVEPRIEPYGNISLDPTALVLHYGQAIYEGLKAYRQQDGSVALFRPEENARRLNASAQRMMMPGMPEDLFIDAVCSLVAHENQWVPSSPDTALYLRPVMIANEAAFGVRRAKRYLFFIVATPVQSHYLRGSDPFRLIVNQDQARIAPGGGGDAKTIGNYGRTIQALEKAKAAGYHNVLWLDGVHRRYIEEVGVTNVFVRMHDRVVTPPLNGCILSGVTRASVMQILARWGIHCTEAEIAIDELIAGIVSGDVMEVFLTGTATHIAPVGTIGFDGKTYELPDCRKAEDCLTLRLSQELDAIQRGRSPDHFAWMHKVSGY